MDLMKVSIEPKNISKYTFQRACLRDFNLSEKQELKQPKMRALKTEDCALPPNPSQQPSSSRRKRPSQSSSELSSSEECLVSEKGREHERKGKTGELSPNFIHRKKSSLDSVYKNGLCSLTNQVKYHTIQT